MFGFMNTGALEVAVLDASKFQLSLARSMLGQIGIRNTRTYDQTFNALDELMVQPCNLLIMDADLPENISGLRLIRCLRSPDLAPLCFTPIIVTTYEPTHRFVEAAVRCGVNFVLSKPYSPRALQQRIDRVIADHGKLELRGGHYVHADVLDTFEARALCANPATLALLVASSDTSEGSLTPHTNLSRQTLINMLQSSNLSKDI
jgi:PleD family two-component response regulator